jgi:leucyl-tRNA synthetase
MVCTNELKKTGSKSKQVLEPILKLLAPFAPFITEELYHKLGHNVSIHTTTYPIFEERYLVEDQLEYPVCINGKKRALISVDAGADPKDIEKSALALDAIQKWIDGKPVRKVIVVPKRMVNIVI